MKGQQRAVVSELEQQLDRPLTPSRGGQFYRPPAERMLDLHAEARMSDSGEPSEGEVCNNWELLQCVCVGGGGGFRFVGIIRGLI